MLKHTITSLFVCLALAVPALAQDGPAITTDPGNDQFARVNNFFKEAVATEDKKTAAAYYQRCIPMLTDYLRRFPNHKNTQPAMYYLGECYFHLGKVNEANQAYSNLVQKYKKGSYVAGAAYRIARNLYSAEQYAQAADYFGLVAANTSDANDVVRSTYFQAQSLMQAGKQAEAKRVYKRVIDSADGARIYKNAAALTYTKILLQEDKYEEALATTQALLLPDIDEDAKAEAAYYAGVASSNLKDEKKALHFYNLCLNSASKKNKGQAQLAIMGIYYARKDYEAVTDLAKRGQFELSPEYKAKQALMVGNSYFVRKNYTRAISYFLDVEKNDKGSDAAFEAGYKKLLCFYNIKDNKLAEKVNRFLENYAVGRGKHKYIHQAFLMKAETLYAQSEFKDAAAAYAAINVDLIDKKYHESLMFRRGASLAKVENYAGAANAFSEFISRFPESENLTSAYLIRATSYVNLDDKQKALRDFDVVIEKGGEGKDLAIALQRSGQLQWTSKNYADSAERFAQLLKKFPDLPKNTRANAHYMCARGKFKVKQYREGLEHFKICQKLDPSKLPEQIAMYQVIGYFSIRDVEQTTAALKRAEELDLQRKSPSMSTAGSVANTTIMRSTKKQSSISEKVSNAVNQSSHHCSSGGSSQRRNTVQSSIRMHSYQSVFC